MRIQYRWIDYLAIFSDSKYIYYYEFLDNLSREEILDIEGEILQLHKEERNEFFQTEYFYCKDNKIFNESIIYVLDKRKINYKIYDTHIFEKKDYDNKPDTFVSNLKTKQINNFIPHDYIQNVLDIIIDFYCNNDKGKIIWSCGLGKSILSILIAQKLECGLVLIGVPSIPLQQQMKNEIMKIYNNYENILYVGGEQEKNKIYKINSTVNVDDIKRFIKKSTGCRFIITTYDSCHILSDNKIKFDFKIADEAHHLVGSENEKTKNAFHKIKSKKALFMTATEKMIENNTTDKVFYSMDDENIFGKLIDEKSIKWAIENKKITDYNLIVLKNTETDIDNIINSLSLDEHDNDVKNSIIHNKELFLSAFMSLKSLEKYNGLTHILIYTNKTENAELVKKYIDIILNLDIIKINKENYYNEALYSKNTNNLNHFKLEISKFKKSSWGIISSVYMLGEGFDCPKLNCVVFSENMESDIRIIQALLRANRLDINFIHKMAYTLIPYIDTQNFITDNKSFDKCRKIIHKIRNVDERIEQKISVVSLNKKKHTTSDDSKETNYHDIIENADDSKETNYHDIIENADELKKIILRLRYSRALGSIYSEEQDEFNYVKQLNKELNITSKEEYAYQITKDKHKNYIENPEEYFKKKCVWSNWYDFIGVDTKKFIQDKNEWINFCKDKNVNSLTDYKELCKEYEIIPINPLDFYIGCLDIGIELEFKRKRRG